MASFWPQCSTSRSTGKARMASRRPAGTSTADGVLSCMLFQVLQRLLELSARHLRSRQDFGMCFAQSLGQGFRPDYGHDAQPLFLDFSLGPHDRYTAGAEAAEDLSLSERRFDRSGFKDGYPFLSLAELKGCPASFRHADQHELCQLP